MVEIDASAPTPTLDGDGRHVGQDPKREAEPEAGDSAIDPRLRLADCARLLSVAERDGVLLANQVTSLRAQADESDRLATALTRVQTALAQERGEREALLQSTSWRLTAPLRVLTERLRGLGAGVLRPLVAGPAESGGQSSDPRSNVDPDGVLPLRAFREPAPASTVRVTAVVDRLEAALSGSAGLAVVIAAAMATRQGAPLRILSRHGPPADDAFDQVLAGQRISFDGNPSFDWLTPDGRGPVVGVTDAERFVTGSRSETQLALTLAEPVRVVYVIDRHELARLTGAERERSALQRCPATRAALVYADKRVHDALCDSGLLDGRDPRAPALVLPAAPTTGGDWQRIADRLLGAAEPT